MSLSIVLCPAAQEEFDEAVDWYEQQSAGLGVEFLNRVEEALDRISVMPEAYPTIFQEIRRIVVRQFPSAANPAKIFLPAVSTPAGLPAKTAVDRANGG